MIFDEFDICFGAAYKVVEQDFDSICSNEVPGKVGLLKRRLQL